MEYTLEILKYIGKFHPLVLHLPIGSLLMTFLLLVVSRYQKVDFGKAIRVGVDFSFAGAFMAALMDYLLSLDEAYDFDRLKFHFWAGIITLILSFSLCILHRINGKEKKLSGKGNGPINAFVQALEQEGLKDFKLTDYRQHSIGEGSATESAAYVQLQTKVGRVAYGCGIDSSIEKSGLLALVSAFNRTRS